MNLIDNRPIIVANSSFILDKLVPVGKFAAWIHWNRPWQDGDAELVRLIVLSGCRFLYGTGLGGDEAHDLIDDSVIGVVDELVLTQVSGRITIDSGPEFWATRCPGDKKEDFRLFTTLDEGIALRFDLLERMISQ